MSESKTKETASRLSLSASRWAGVLPCLARPLSLSCHATTIAQLDVSVCLIFKRVALCLCIPCCLAPTCLVPLLPRLPCVLCGSGLLCVVCGPGLLCLPAVRLALCSAPWPALPHCACAVCPCLATVWPGLPWLPLPPVVLACCPLHLSLPWLPI